MVFYHCASIIFATAIRLIWGFSLLFQNACLDAVYVVYYLYIILGCLVAGIKTLVRTSTTCNYDYFLASDCSISG
jgi:hypothetical protein